MVGIVVVSHSGPLARAAVGLASQMGDPDRRPAIRVAAGLTDDTLGTSALTVSEAITELGRHEDVLVLVDLGSAILSAQTALDLVDPDIARRVRISPAPLVEGLVSACVAVSAGADLDEADRQAREALEPKIAHLGGPDLEPVPAPARPARGVLTFTTTIQNPHGLHARPAASLVTALAGLDADVELVNATSGRGPAPARSLNKVATLGLRRGDQLRATVSGPDAAEALARLSQLAADHFGEPLTEQETGSPQRRPAPGSGQQIVIGPVQQLAPAQVPTGVRATTPELERRRLDRALAAVDADLATISTDSYTDIFAAQRLMLADPDLVDQLHEQVDSGVSAVAAVAGVLTPLADSYQELTDPYQRERGQDVRSLQSQLWAALTGRPTQPAGNEPRVLVLPELDAATATRLDPATTLGVITTGGGATGHGIIVAASRGIAVLPGRSEAAALTNGQMVAFDPRAGQLWVEPDADQLAAIGQINAERTQESDLAGARANSPAVARNGRRILVEANVASLADAERAALEGADGIGLVRTEILFSGAGAPSVQAQADMFIAIGRAMGGRPITIRTWDVGGDKSAEFMPQFEERNPFLGERGLRAMMRMQDLFADQLRAIVMAAQQTPVRVMFPMVTEPAELAWATSQLDAVRATSSGTAELPVGIMVEVPAAAIRAADFRVDFASIGTNDLAQYVTASDRGNSAVSHLARANSPAVLDMIAMTCAALRDVPVAVCGDLASDPASTATLLELGVGELSVRPPLVGLVKQAVRAW